MHSATSINLSAILLPSLHLFTDFTSKVNKNQNKNKNRNTITPPPKTNPLISAVFVFFCLTYPTSKQADAGRRQGRLRCEVKFLKFAHHEATRHHKASASSRDGLEEIWMIQPPDTDVPMKKHKPKGNYIMFPCNKWVFPKIGGFPPKWMIYDGNPYQNGWFGVPLFSETHTL